MSISVGLHGDGEPFTVKVDHAGDAWWIEVTDHHIDQVTIFTSTLQNTENLVLALQFALSKAKDEQK